MNLSKKSFDELPEWDKAIVVNGFKAFVKSCNSILNRPANYKIGRFGVASDWKLICTKAKILGETSMDNSALTLFFSKNFVPFLVSNNSNSEGLFTGYYEPQLFGSRKKTSRFRYPLYAMPENDLRSLDRKSIDEGAFDGSGLEMAYVDDEIELFFLHVQGSGRVSLEDGTVLRVGYAGQNGRSYKSIGRYLVDEGVFELEEVTADKIKNWLRAHPSQISNVLQQNPSYIFFRELKGEGPIGSQGVALTPEASLAVDRKHLPMGLPIWLDTTLNGNMKYRKLLVSQDTGGAINGIVRGDIFFGYGKEAEQKAGDMKNMGRYFIFLPIKIASRYIGAL